MLIFEGMRRQSLPEYVGGAKLLFSVVKREF